MARAQAVDVVRGGALVAMVVYHVCWFANDYALVHVPVGTWPWRAFQRSIAGSFFALVGVSTVLASTPQLHIRAFAIRLTKLLACAAIVSGTSWILDPDRLVTFGILHSIAVCSVLALLFRGTGRWNAAIGVAWVALATVGWDLFDQPGWRWTGLGNQSVQAFDHQPLVPWFGVVLVGMAAGSALVDTARAMAWRSDHVGAVALGFVGRHTLFLYMAHVPMIVACCELVARLR